MIQWAKFASKAAKLGKATKKGAKKFYKKNPVFNKADVTFIKQNPKLSAGAAGVGLIATAGITDVASGTYNLATGQRNVRVKKQTAKELKELKKLYKI